MLKKIKKDGFEQLVLNYYEKVNGKLTEKEIPEKVSLYSNEDIFNYKMVGYCLEPFSYLSFELVLSRNALIPESVFHYTFATLPYIGKPNYYELRTKHGLLIYREIPKTTFFVGLEFVETKGRKILIATKEKAFLDYIYVSNFKFKTATDFNKFFDNYRIDRDEFMLLDFKKLEEYGKLYRSQKIDLFIEYLEKGEFNFD